MRRARQAPKELKALGAHPDSGEAVRILDGRYGPYVTDGTTNASVPKGTQVEAVTMASAIELLNARAGMGGKKAKKARQKLPSRAKEESCAEKEDGVKSGKIVPERFMKRHIPTSSPFDLAIAASVSIAISN